MGIRSVSMYRESSLRLFCAVSIIVGTISAGSRSLPGQLVSVGIWFVVTGRCSSIARRLGNRSAREIDLLLKVSPKGIVC